MIELKNGSAQLSDDDERPSHPIDHFLYSIAEDQGERGIGVILSGAGSDGTLGLKAIGDRGGLTFAQDAKSAKHDSMPRSAATTGVADHVLPPAEIAAALLQYVEYLHGLEELTSSGSRQDEIKEAVPKIAETLMAVTNHNFQHYKTNTLVPRIQRRMQVLQIGSVDEYVNHLQRHEDEATSLFRELLIGVTEFFRDPDAFESLNRMVLPKLFAGRKPDDCVRIWVAGCANGSEAFTLAILCREILDNMAAPCEVKIFATDIDERALSIAREGFYPVGIEDQVSPDRLKRFFLKRGKQYQVAKEIRDLVLFSSHNLISDPPFSRLDLVTCRNLLIYLGEHLQNMLIPLFHYALRPSGFLFLGPSENITSHVELFKPLDINYRISQRNGTAMGAVPGPKPSVSIRERLPTTMNQTDSKPDAAVDLTAIGQRIVLDEFAPRYAIIDEKGQIFNSSANIDQYLSLGGGDYQNNIVRMVDPGLRIGLRAAIAEAKKVRRRVQHENMSIRVGDKMQRMMITVQPMPRLGENEPLMMVVFHEVGLPVDLDIVEEQLESSRDADSINAQLELELETIRSDLDRSLQDMEATNEELKSSNEELILMNEVLQSANEEIRATSDTVERANADLENLLRSTQIATVFLDKDLNILSFTPAIADIYSLIPTDVGRPLERLVPLVKDMPPLPDPMQVDGGETVEDTIVANSGKSYIRRVLPYRSRSHEKQGVVVTFLDVSQLKESQELFELLIDASAQIVWMTNAEGFVTTDSPSWREFTGQAYDEWIGHGWIDAIHPDDREATMAKWNEVLKTGEVLSLEYRLRHRGGSYRWTQVCAVAQCSVDGSVRRWIGMNSDIDERKRNEDEIAATKERLQLCLEVSNVAPWHWDAETNDLVPNPILNRLFGFDEEDSPKIAEFIARIDPSARERVSTSIENAIKNGDTYDEEYQICWPNGEVRHVRGRGRARLSNDGTFADFFGVLIDISDRIVQEIDLAEREAHLRRVINNQLGLVGVIDRNGVLMEIDDRSLEIGRTRREEVIGKHFADAPWWTYDPAVAKQVRDAMERAFAGEIVRFDVSLFAHGKDGVLIDFMIAPVTDSSGKVEYLIPSGVDIVDRKRAEKEQQNISKRMRMALRAGGMAAWEWTPKESFWTPELYDLLGIDKNQKADSESFFSLVHPEDVEELKRSWQAAVDGTDEYECEFRIVRPSGEIRWTMGMGEVVRNNAGKVVRMYGINWDSTKDHLHEEALRESQQRAMQASASKSEFLANMSHEIRTPMTAILGYAELLKDLVDGDEAIQHLQTIRRNGDYLLDIINDILDLSKIEAGKFDVEYERFEPARVIEDVRSIMEVLRERRRIDVGSGIRRQATQSGPIGRETFEANSHKPGRQRDQVHN